VRRLREFTQFNEQCDRHVAREVDRAKRELSREGTADPNLISELDGLVRTCKKIVAEAQTKAEADNFIDGWEIGDKLREQVWEKLEKLTRSFHEDRKCRDIERGIDELDRGLNIEVPKILESVPTDVKPKLHALIEKGKQILVDARGALAADSCEKAGYILENAEELHWQFKDILHQVGFEEELIDYNEQYDEMYADFDDMEFEMDREEFKRVMNEKRFGVDEMDRMKKISKDVLVEYMDYSFDTDDQTLEFASAAGLENTKLQALIQAKNDLVREVKTLRSQVTNLKQEIQNITAELVEYNFGIGAAKDEAKTLAGQLSTMSEAEAKEEFRKIKTKAIAQKVTDGIIGFPDADDTIDNWFAAFALKAKNKGLIYGNADGTLNPAGQLNYSEAAIAFGRIAGLNGQESDSAAARNLADWAEQGVAALEQKGVNLDFMNNVEAADAIKREEVAILLNEALDLPDVPITEAGFSDINEADTREQQAIANVNAAGIMTGKGGTDEFGIGENLSRAALTKVLSIAAEKIE
ncbi:MAG: S-layer homology domain-containing protein, partial [Candidatus Aenigmarchaeota archaeon]|nr:S-layer homology domain-containing protein [Candidatus Aenigmarchaeota archaeon]